jgi:hypothetical protein
MEKVRSECAAMESKLKEAELMEAMGCASRLKKSVD